VKILIHALGLLVLALAEVACYLALKKAGVSTPIAVGSALVLCLSIFLFVGLRLSSEPSRRQPYSKSQQSPYVSRRPSGGSAQSPSARLVVRRTGSDEDDDFHVPTSMSSPTHTRSEAYLSELYESLIQKREEFVKLLAETGVELGRFDYSVLKTLERNSPGSVEGVVTARKIHHALEHRVSEINHFLDTQGTVDPEKGKMLLHGDLEIREENQLTSLFKSTPVPPIKISEVDFQLRVLMKRISRRRSIFRPSEMLDASGGEQAEPFTEKPLDEDNDNLA